MKIFDGRKIAKKKEKILCGKVTGLRRAGITPKLVSVVVGNEKGALFYQGLKRKAAKRVGAKLSISDLPASISKEKLVGKIKELNKDSTVHGVMVQLPLPINFSKKDRTHTIRAIDPSKDVDGMLDVSDFKSPVVLSILEAVDQGRHFLPSKPKAVVVGAAGFEGKKIVKELLTMKYDVVGLGRDTKDLPNLTKNADLIISATGSTGIIKKEMVKEGALLIDIGYPNGDIEKEAYEKASFVSPVPGGIGPLTIYFLIENVVSAAL